VVGGDLAQEGLLDGYLVRPMPVYRQAGILTPAPSDKQSASVVASFNVTAGAAAGLADLLKTLTSRARILTAGGPPPDLGIGQPPSDSDVLGPSMPADGLTVTLGVGSSLFDDRFGLGSRSR
jgi:deferrochelatase/peroxidase EfeB